ncbi:hypothetical protein ACLK5F_002260 [Vibrio fluvialis]|uniref:hypothetical protein n=1 Tax=Vibrio TaxID=662 RepID=UPI001ABE77F9|nr:MULTISPECIES: hypothetical protein [Vibrio]MBY8068799.1 hypothetical protein [Vibrio fluvialis]MBY8171060.1 hypothetical protein [Vibrio fluvialis]MBY8288583.1 hypothetical protein [Vibrio fluvialis]QTH10534.1 hypothetical protein JTJ03_18640 [Vibrio fluvialis]WJG27178.1 hypothetical protein QSU96_05525 [Vibrio furnissii]
MLDAWKWIKWGALAALLVTVWVLWLKLDASQLEQKALSDKLAKAKADNQTHLTTIEVLKGESEQANSLLVRRQREHIAAEEKLNADMAALKAELANVQCSIPDSVIDRLREPY